MIIYLKGADFSEHNIGTLSTYSIRFSGNVTNSNTSVDRESNTGYTTTITLAEGYELNGSITVTMGGTDITSTAVSGLTITIPTKVTGNVVINVPTVKTAGGDEPDKPDIPEGGTDLVLMPLTATSTTTNTYIDKNTGAVTDGAGSVRYIFAVTSDKEYYADGYAPNASGNAAAIAYFDASGNYISYESPASSSVYSNYKLTVPSNAKTVSIHSITSNSAPVLNVAVYGTLVTATSTVKDTYISISTGAETSGAGSIRKIYPITDVTKTYYATGYSPSTETVAAIAYFGSNGAYISGERFASGKDFTNQLLSIPMNAASLSIHGKSDTTFGLFYV